MSDSANKPLKRTSPEQPEMRKMGIISGVPIANVNLNASRSSNPAVHVPDAVKHWSKELEGCLEPVGRHVLACVPMREVAVKAQVREPLNELNRPPHVLGKRGPVRFYIQRDPSSCAGVEHFFDQLVSPSVVL
jgi:hypothetical protein